MDIRQEVLNCRPLYWDRNGELENDLLPESQEFLKVKDFIMKCLLHPVQSPIKSISRIQNIHDLGQVIISEQRLVSIYPAQRFYRVRRFVKLNECYRYIALNTNLDYRRCNRQEPFQFSQVIADEVKRDDIIFVVKVLTSAPNENIIYPKNSLEYFIDYVVTFQ